MNIILFNERYLIYCRYYGLHVLNSIKAVSKLNKQKVNIKSNILQNNNIVGDVI